jgi:carbamoyl-phosphate synthase large subunit
MKSKERTRVLIAGIGGASLGTEILKCLLLADRYTIFGADISPYAFGHYQGGFDETFVVDRSDYIGSIVEVCRRANIDFVVPGADETTCC